MFVTDERSEQFQLLVVKRAKPLQLGGRQRRLRAHRRSGLVSPRQRYAVRVDFCNELAPLSRERDRCGLGPHAPFREAPLRVR